MSIELPNPSSWLVGAAGVTGVVGTGDCRRGDRRVGAGEGLLERPRRGDLGCPASGAGGASSDIDGTGRPLASSCGTDSSHGGGGGIFTHVGVAIDVDIAAVGAVGGAVDEDGEVAGRVVKMVLAEIVGATCDLGSFCDDCGVAGMMFT
jgi:hypothetical protein